MVYKISTTLTMCRHFDFDIIIQLNSFVADSYVLVLQGFGQLIWPLWFSFRLKLISCSSLFQVMIKPPQKIMLTKLFR